MRHRRCDVSFPRGRSVGVHAFVGILPVAEDFHHFAHAGARLSFFKHLFMGLGSGGRLLRFLFYVVHIDLLSSFRFLSTVSFKNTQFYLDGNLFLAIQLPDFPGSFKAVLLLP